MKKRIILKFFGICFFIFITLLFVCLFFYENKVNVGGCPFCHAQIITEQKYYEDENVMGFYAKKSIVPGHCLIIPKRHVIRFEMLDAKEIESIFLAIKKTNMAVSSAYGTSSYLLLQKNGKEVGQSVPHIHMHYIPRKQGSSIYYLVFRFFINPFLSPIKEREMKENVRLLSYYM